MNKELLLKRKGIELYRIDDGNQLDDGTNTISLAVFVDGKKEDDVIYKVNYEEEKRYTEVQAIALFLENYINHYKVDKEECNNIVKEAEKIFGYDIKEEHLIQTLEDYYYGLYRTALHFAKYFPKSDKK
jgi:hypothetical protein